MLPGCPARTRGWSRRLQFRTAEPRLGERCLCKPPRERQAGPSRNARVPTAPQQSYVAQSFNQEPPSACVNRLFPKSRGTRIFTEVGKNNSSQERDFSATQGQVEERETCTLQSLKLTWKAAGSPAGSAGARGASAHHPSPVARATEGVLKSPCLLWLTLDP